MPSFSISLRTWRADVLVEAAQDVVAAIDHGDVGAEVGEDAGKFQRDIAAALDHDAPRQPLQMKCLVRGDHVLDAGDRGAMIGRAAGRDQDVFRGDGLAVREPNGMGILQHRAASVDVPAGLLDGLDM